MADLDLGRGGPEPSRARDGLLDLLPAGSKGRTDHEDVLLLLVRIGLDQKEIVDRGEVEVDLDIGRPCGRRDLDGTALIDPGGGL